MCKLNSCGDVACKPQFAEMLNSINAARVAPYRDYFQCKSDKEALGAYFWGQAVATAIQPTLGIYEVVLRNAIHREASKLSSGGLVFSYPWYDRQEQGALPLRHKTQSKVDEVLFDKTGARRTLAPDQVVASLSFGFWSSLLEGLTQRERPKILTRVFSGHPHSRFIHWSKRENAAALIRQLKRIQALRNAVAHHEPIWKAHRLMGTERHWSQSVLSLREFQDEILTVLSWCCPASADIARQSYATRTFRHICSTDAVHAYMLDPLGAGSMQPFNSTGMPVELQAAA